MWLTLTKEIEMLQETVLQWVASCNTNVQLDTCSRFIEQKWEQFRATTPEQPFAVMRQSVNDKRLTLNHTMDI